MEATAASDLVKYRADGMFNTDLPRSAWERLIDEWIFSERDRALLKRRLLDGITFERLADEFDLSPRQVKAIVKRGLGTLINRI